MANNLIYIKRTTVTGRTPNTTGSYTTNSQYISSGELALNLTDGKLFSSNGTTYFEVGANTLNQNVSNTLTIKTVSANNSNGSAGQVLTSNGSGTYWSTVTSGGSLTVRSTYGNGGTVNTTVTSVTGINFDESTGLHVTDQGSGNVFVSLGSGYKYITVSGQTTITAVGEDTLNIANGQGITLTTSNSAPKTLTITSSGYVNTAAAYTFTNVHIHTANVSVNGAIIANGGAGSSGQVLTSSANGNVYWSTPSAGVNTAAQYTFTNTITFSNTITVANISANGTTGTNGQVLTSNGTTAYWATPSGSSGGVSITFSNTAPSSPSANSLWWNTDLATLFLYYNDGSSTQWVQAVPGTVPSKTLSQSTYNYATFRQVGTISGAVSSTVKWFPQANCYIDSIDAYTSTIAGGGGLSFKLYKYQANTSTLAEVEYAPTSNLITISSGNYHSTPITLSAPVTVLTTDYLQFAVISGSGGDAALRVRYYFS